MNKKIFRFILAALFIVSIFSIGACSSEETSQPAKKITLPKHEQETGSMPAGEPAEGKSTIEETPIVEPPAESAPQAEQAPGSAEPEQSSGTAKESGMESVPPTPESESAVVEEPEIPEGSGAEEVPQPPAPGK